MVVVKALPVHGLASVPCPDVDQEEEGGIEDWLIVCGRECRRCEVSPQSATDQYVPANTTC